MSAGTQLRRARERQGISLDKLSRSTKISPALLEALENEEIDKLPAAFYTRAFLRTYANEVGLDPDETVRDYLSQFEPEPVVDEPSPARVDSHAGYESEATGAPQRLQLLLPDVSARVLIAGAAVLMLAVYLFYPRQHFESGEQVSAQEPSVAQASMAPAPPIDAAPAVAVPPGGDVLRLDINAGGPCWVQATTPDGRQVLQALLQPGERQTIEIRDEVVLRVGDPGAFGYTIDGVSGRSLGTAGVPVTVRISKENYREFLSS